MHLDEGQIQRLLHGELSGPARSSAREHIAECGACRQAVSEAERDEGELSALLRQLDHPVPAVEAEAVVARARAKERQVDLLRRAAGFILAVCIAGGAYAIPGSPVRQWVGVLIERARGDRGSSPSERTGTHGPGFSGIAITPGREVLIDFTSPQAAGQARLTLTDDAVLSVRAPIGAATFSSDVDRLTIDNRGASATFEIRIPRAAERVEIRIAGSPIFLKDGPRITVEGSQGSSDLYVLPLTRSGR